MSVVSGYEYGMTQNTNHNDSFGLKGNFALYRDNQLVFSQKDAITWMAYATLWCKLFNNTNACNLATGGWVNNALGTGTFVGTSCSTGTPSNAFVGKTSCSMLGVALSTDTSAPGNTPTSATCPSIITANGMTPVKATTSYTTNTQSIVLTASWTATGSQTFDKACLVAWNDKANSASYWTFGAGSAAASNAFAIQLFTSQSVVSGQTWSATWTFNA